MRPKDYTERSFIHAVATGAKVSVRWRKASATWVIYVGGKVYMSGLDSAAEAITLAKESLKPDVIDTRRA